MMARQEVLSTQSDWPDLFLSDWADTCDTLHLWTQVVGKIRLAHAPMINHWWQVPLYVTCRGLTTSPIPYGSQNFQIDFDFIDHILKLQTAKGDVETMDLAPRTVADFHAELMGRLRGLGLETRIWTMPVEIPEAIPFEHDRTHAPTSSTANSRRPSSCASCFQALWTMHRRGNACGLSPGGGRCPSGYAR